MAQITDGESYLVGGFFPAGVEIPRGESDGVGRQADDSTEFHYVQEMSGDDIQRNIGYGGMKCTVPAHAFWIESRSAHGRQSWRVCYVVRRGTLLVDVLCLRDKLAAPGRCKLMVALKSFRQKAFRDGLEGEI